MEAPLLAADFAEQARASKATAFGQEQPTSVFVVHGRSPKALAELEGYLSSVGVSAVVLSRLDDSPQSLFQKFWSVATQARFAIVLLSADDYGASRQQFEAVNVGDRVLQFRARQNVILEQAFSMGASVGRTYSCSFRNPTKFFQISSCRRTSTESFSITFRRQDGRINSAPN